jgi:hypothetical protein
MPAAGDGEALLDLSCPIPGAGHHARHPDFHLE